MSKEELLQHIETQKQELKYLATKVKCLQEEKEFLVSNFQQTTQVLLERIKDLETKNEPTECERPQTATVLSKISKNLNLSCLCRC